jgi:methyltransferase (TIGR00027 family)
MALFRALESVRPAGERLFEDPLAHHFLSRPLRVVRGLARVPPLGSLISWFIDRRWPGARTSAVARTRLVDEALTAMLRAGVDQVVILGAGLDCRAQRLPGIERARVFEVDHPATQAAKRTRLAALGSGVAARVVFVGVDFTRDDLGQALAQAGYDSSGRSFFVWEGVTNYLTADAVDGVLRWVVGNSAPRSRILFTYVHRGLLDGSVAFAGTHALVATLERAGEPWTFGLDPAELPAYLAARGLLLLEDIGAADYRARYMGPAARQMRGYEFYRAALAEVRPRSGGRA